MTEPLRQESFPKIDGFTGKKILVVDDNEYVCEMISKTLEKYMGLEVIKINCGSQAIAAALTGRYDAAIIDLTLQGSSGSKIARTIKTMLPALPVLAMCAQPADEMLSSLRRYGITRILQKPFKMTILIDEIVEMLGVKKTVTFRELQ
jgi:DNA-binding NtrC family response regulator